MRSIFSLIFCLLLCHVTFSADNPKSAVKVLALGNSITNGDPNHYRYELWKAFIDSGINVDFIGSVSDSAIYPLHMGKKFDSDHEGHNGWKTDQINDQLSQWLRNYTPDIVLLHIGTNDLWFNSVSHSLDQVKKTINYLVRGNSKVKIFLAQIIPLAGFNEYAEKGNDWIRQYNEGIKGLVLTSQFANADILIVDHNSTFEDSDFIKDGVHPNKAGAKKMARNWANPLGLITQGSESAKHYTDSLSLIPKRFISQSRAYPMYCRIKGLGTEKKVALTFDDGPSRISEQIMDILEKHEVKATFFWLGKNLSENKKAVDRAINEGHQIANHSWGHTNGSRLNEIELWNEQVLKTSEEFNTVVGIKPKYFRPPFGAISDKQIDFLGKKGVITILWSLTTLDWDDSQNSSEDILMKFEKYLHEGAIVLLHDYDQGRSRQGMLEALDGIISYGKSNGYSFVTIDRIVTSKRN